MAPAPNGARRRSPGGQPRPRPGSTSSPRSRWLLAAGVGVLLLAAYLIYSRRAQAAPTVTSGTPGPDLTGSQAQPAGGASNSDSGSMPGNLTPVMSGLQTDPVQNEIQQTNTVNAESPQAIPAATVDPTAGAVTTTPVAPGYGVNTVTPGVDAQQAFAAAVLGVTPTPNMTLDQLNAQLVAQGLPAQSYPSTITSNRPAQITSTVTAPSPPISDIQRHFVYGRDPDA